MFLFAILFDEQRYCRGFLFSHKYPQKFQSIVVIQAAIRRIIAQKQYNRLKFGVILTFLLFDISLFSFKIIIIKVNSCDHRVAQLRISIMIIIVIIIVIIVIII